MSQTRTPLSVTGGCLCGAIRYTVTFPANAEWPPKRNSTCQCTMCRKFTGALLPQGISLPTSYISPPLLSNETYKSYQSSPTAYRSFCSNCGSSLAFNYNRCPEVTEIYHGSLDEEVLCGKKVAGAEDGTISKREGSDIGYDLCKAPNHNWIDNSIKGITDKGEGNLYLRGSDVPVRGLNASV